MKSLKELLRKQAEQNPNASYFNLDLLKYQVQLGSKYVLDKLGTVGAPNAKCQIHLKSEHFKDWCQNDSVLEWSRLQLQLCTITNHLKTEPVHYKYKMASKKVPII